MAKKIFIFLLILSSSLLVIFLLLPVLLSHIFSNLFSNVCTHKEPENSDKETFVLLDNFYGTDINNVYYYSYSKCPEAPIVLEEADVNTFQSFKNGYAKDKKNFYYLNNIIDADLNSLKVFSHTFAKDKNSVFVNGRKYKLDYFIDPDDYSTEELKRTGKSGSRFLIDTKSFTFLKGGYAKDKNQVYEAFGGSDTFDIVENVDIESFSVDYNDKTIACDKNNFYSYGRVLSKEDDRIKSKSITCIPKS